MAYYFDNIKGDEFDYNLVKKRIDENIKYGKFGIIMVCVVCTIILYFFPVAIYPIIFYVIYKSCFQFYGFERANDFISSLGQNIDTLLRRDNKLTQEVEDLRKKIVFLENLIEKMIDSKISFLEKDIAKMSKEKDKDDFYV